MSIAILLNIMKSYWSPNNCIIVCTKKKNELNINKVVQHNNSDNELENYSDEDSQKSNKELVKKRP